MHACFQINRTKHSILASTLLLLALLSLPFSTTWAGTLAIGSADGSFETGLGGMVTQGDVRLVPSWGSLRPTQGNQAALLTTRPDEGAALADADTSLLRIEKVTLPADARQLRLDYNFLTNEVTPSFFNDRFAVKLLLINSGGEEMLLEVDTFDTFYPAPGTGYRQQTGFRTLVADLSARAGSGEPFTLELRLYDVGDGRVDSALFLDNLRFAAAGEPQARANLEYLAVNPGEGISLDASGSTDADGSIVEYRWEFGNGAVGTGPLVEYAYPREGLYQATLTVTDPAGNTATDTFIIVVGSLTGNIKITSLTTDKQTYPANSLVTISATLTNSGSTASDVTVSATITDQQGTVFDTISHSLTVDTQASANTSLQWNTAQQPQGTYRITLKASDRQGILLDQKEITIYIEPAFTLTRSALSISPTYTYNNKSETIKLSSTFSYSSNIPSDVQADYILKDQQNNTLDQGTILISLPSGTDTVTREIARSTHTFTTGQYPFTVTLSRDRAVLSELTATFNVLANIRIETERSVSPVTVMPGEKGRVRITIKLKGVRQ